MKVEVNELGLQEKIGQMLMVGMDTTNVIDKIDDLILKYKIGGILLYKKNYKSYGELVELINYIKKLNTANKIPLFIAIDQEGGRVNRMPKDFKNLPPAYKLAQYKKEDLVKKAGNITGNMLNKTGFNLDFAPVLDIKRFEDKHAIGDRAFSDDKEEVINAGIAYMKELQDKNVVSVIKHFPGHGATKEDSHFILPVINKDISELENEDMKVFEEVIKNGADAMLVSHLKMKSVSKYPSSMSRKFITKYIRKKYRYKGLIITDDVRMKGVQILYGKNAPVKKAFEAGNDIVMFKYYENDNKMIEKLIKKAEKSTILQARINRSVKRILEIKDKYNINDNEISIDNEFLKNTNNEIQEINNKLGGTNG